MMIDAIPIPLSAWLSCTTLGDSTNAMIVMGTTNSALALPALGNVIADLVRRLPYACWVLWALASMPCLYSGRWLDQIWHELLSFISFNQELLSIIFFDQESLPFILFLVKVLYLRAMGV